MALQENKSLQRKVRKSYMISTVSIALVLFLFIMLINATLNFFLKGEKK